MTGFATPRDSINALAEQLRKVHKPYAGGRFRAAILNEGFPRFLTRSLVFCPETVPSRPSASYGTLRFIEHWQSDQNEALGLLSRILSGRGEIANQKIGFRFAQSGFEYRSFSFGNRDWSGWEMRSRCDNTPTDHQQPLNYGSIVGFGLRPYLGAEQAINDWIFDTATDTTSNAVPNLNELVTFLPDTRARIGSALWTPGKLSLTIEINVPPENVELQIIHAGSSHLPQVIHVSKGPSDIKVPDDARELLIYLMHRSGDCIMQVHLRSVYESFGQVPDELIAMNRAESDLGKGEGDQIEFKPFISPNDAKETEIVDTVIAFANTVGGRIYVGVNDRDASPQGESELRRIFKRACQEALKAQADRLRWLITNRVAPTPRFVIDQIQVFGEPMVAVTIEPANTTHYDRGSNEVWVRRGGSNERPKPTDMKVAFGSSSPVFR